MDKFWEFKNISNGEAELFLYGAIFDTSWREDDVTPRKFVKDLKDLGDIKKLTVRINSPGGGVFAGQAIHSILKSHKAEVIVRIDGIAASAASVVAMAGDTVIMPRNSMMMIHNPMTIGIGNSNDFRKVADTLDKIRESMIAAYKDKSGMDEKKIIELLDEETWFTAEDAIEYGLADKVDTENPVAASLQSNTLYVNGQKFDVSKFKKRPPITEEAGKDAGFNFGQFQVPGAASAVINEPGRKQLPQQPAPAPQPVGQEEEGKLEIKNVDELRQHFPDLVAQVENAARENAVTEERQRIKNIDEISSTLSPELVAKAKYEEPMTAQDLALTALKADALKGQRHLDDVDKDTKDSGVENIEGNPHPNAQSEEEERNSKAKSLADFVNKRRKQ